MNHQNKRLNLFLTLLTALILGACSLPETATVPVDTATPQNSAIRPSISVPTPTITPTSAPAQTETPLPPTVTLTPQPSPTLTLPPPQPLVWALNPNDGVLLKVDPATNTILAKIPMDGGSDVLLVSRDAIWVGNRTTLYKLSPTDGQIVAKAALPAPAVSLAASNGAVWVGMIVIPKDLPAGIDFSPSGKLARINPDNMQITGTVDTVCSPSSIEAASASIWVAAGCYTQATVSEVDFNTLQRSPISNQADTPNNPALLPATLGTNLALTSDAAWMTSGDGITIYKIGLSTHKTLQQSEVLKNYNATPLAIAAGAGQVWLALTDGKIVGLDPASLGVITLVDLGNPLNTVTFAFSADGVWVNDPYHARLTRINPNSKQVIARLSTGSAYKTPTPGPNQPTTAICPGSPTSHLRVGDQAHVALQPSQPNRVRKAAGKDAAILGLIYPGEIVSIMDGPACMDGWTWWQIRSNKTGLTGWTAEGDASAYWLEPGPP